MSMCLVCSMFVSLQSCNTYAFVSFQTLTFPALHCKLLWSHRQLQHHNPHPNLQSWRHHPLPTQRLHWFPSKDGCLSLYLALCFIILVADRMFLSKPLLSTREHWHALLHKLRPSTFAGRSASYAGSTSTPSHNLHISIISSSSRIGDDLGHLQVRRAPIRELS